MKTLNDILVLGMKDVLLRVDGISATSESTPTYAGIHMRVQMILILYFNARKSSYHVIEEE